MLAPFDMIGPVSTLVRSGQPQDQQLEPLRARIAELEAALDARATEVDRIKGELAAFKARYRQDVGLLHDELDDLERAIAEIELGEIAQRLKEAGRDTDAAETGAPETAPRFTSDAVRRLFRDVARAIHPDLAGDPHARDRRHSLMVEANKAYAMGDEARLRRILEAWERSPEAVQGTDPESTRERLERRVAQLEQQLGACASELTELQDSPLWKLKAMVDEWASRGQDLVRDQVRRLKRDILVARNKLAAIQPPS